MCSVTREEGSWCATDLSLTAVDDGRAGVVLNSTALGSSSLKGADNVHGSLVGNLAEDDVALVQPRSDDSGDEELGAVARKVRLVEHLNKHVVKAYVLGPALAMDNRPGLSCLRVKFSSANFSP